MVVRDEETFLYDCLESVRGIVDEIVVVDTGSTDGTMAIARGAGARIIQEHWDGDFSSARNRALAACTGTWVLSLDADERLVPGQKERLLKLLRDPKIDAYQIIVRSVLSLDAGKKAVQVMPYPRLFRRHEAVRFERPIHEQIAPSILRNGGKIAPADIVIEHIGYDQGYEVLKRKVQRNLGSLLALAEGDPNDWYSRFQLARSFMLVQDFPAVAYHATGAIRTPGVPLAALSSLHNLLAEAALRMRNIGLAIRHCEKSLALIPDQAGAMWFLAGAHMTHGNPRLAIPVLENMIALSAAEKKVAPNVEDLVIPQETVNDALGRCYFAVGRWERAALAFATALQHNPSFAGTGERLIASLKKLGQNDVALRCLRMATRGDTRDEGLLRYRAMIENETGYVERADETLDRVLAVHPADPLALTWKAAWALQRKDSGVAALALRLAEERGVANDDLARCAFELAVQEGHYADALARLERLEGLYAPGDYQALKLKIMRLQQRASTFS